MYKLQVKRTKSVTTNKEIIIENYKLIEDEGAFLKPIRCGGCNKKIGLERPISIAWDETNKKSLRLCAICTAKLMEHGLSLNIN